MLKTKDKGEIPESSELRLEPPVRHTEPAGPPPQHHPAPVSWEAPPWTVLPTGSKIMQFCDKPLYEQDFLLS